MATTALLTTHAILVAGKSSNHTKLVASFLTSEKAIILKFELLGFVELVYMIVKRYGIDEYVTII